VVRFDPFGVKDTRFVDALVSVCAEEVALRLQQIRRQPRLTITIEVGERRGKCRDRHAVFDGGGNGNAPVVLRFLDDAGEITIEEKIMERGIAFISFDNAVEKFRANDATAAPDRGDVAEVQVTFILPARGAE